MAAYNGQPGESKPTDFELTPFQPRSHEHLRDWCTRGLAGIKPWLRGLQARMRRVWDHNQGGYVNGVHSTERGHRETRCRANVAMLERRQWYRACEELPLRYKLSARSLVLTARRLVTAGDWWKPRSYVDPWTGEIKQTVYLPEDTWSAETCLDYCVSFLERLYASARGMAERVTPHYKPHEAQTVERRVPSALKDDPVLSAIIARAGRAVGWQPDLPSTT